MNDVIVRVGCTVANIEGLTRVEMPRCNCVEVWAPEFIAHVRDRFGASAVRDMADQYAALAVAASAAVAGE